MPQSYYELTRVSVFLPIKPAIISVIYQLISQLNHDFGGCTHSTIGHYEAGEPFPGFKGYWWLRSMNQPEAENVALVMTDVDQRLDDPRLEYFSQLKRHLEEKTKEAEVWIVCHPIWRFI